MKNLFYFTIILIFISCESSADNEEPVLISKGYITLNQGSVSAVDYYDIDSDSLHQSVFSKNNNSETLAGYAEHITMDDKYVYVSLQGSFGEGDGGKVVILNKQFEKLGEIDPNPNIGNVLYIYSIGNKQLLVTFRNSSNKYLIKKYMLTESNGVVTAMETLSYTFHTSGYGYGRLAMNDQYLAIHDANLVEFISLNDFTFKDSLRTDYKLNDLSYYKNSFLVSFVKFKAADINGDEAFDQGGLLKFSSNGAITDTIKKNYTYTKLLSTDDRLFAIKWSVKSRKYNPQIWSYSYENSRTFMTELNGSLTETELFEKSSLINIKSSWLHFNYDKQRNLLLLTNGAFLPGEAALEQVDMSGTVLKSTVHSAQVTNAVIITE